MEKLLLENKKVILEKWEDSILESYAHDTFVIFKKQKNPFANPVGHKVRTGLEELYDVLCEPSDNEVLTPYLEQLISLRAVQEISASSAVSFVFKLKYIVRQELTKKTMTGSYKEWLAFDARIDAAALAVFDMYMASRERINRVRISETTSGRGLVIAGGCPSGLLRHEKGKKSKSPSVQSG